jgi:hypothetical protein
MLSAVVQEQVRCAMEVGVSTLGDAARVNLTLGCRMGDATLGDVERTLGVFEAAVAAELEEWRACGWGWGEAAGEECLLLANVRWFGGLAE